MDPEKLWSNYFNLLVCDEFKSQLKVQFSDKLIMIFFSADKLLLHSAISVFIDLLSIRKGESTLREDKSREDTVLAQF